MQVQLEVRIVKSKSLNLYCRLTAAFNNTSDRSDLTVYCCLMFMCLSKHLDRSKCCCVYYRSSPSFGVNRYRRVCVWLEWWVTALNCLREVIVSTLFSSSSLLIPLRKFITRLATVEGQWLTGKDIIMQRGRAYRRYMNIWADGL